MQKVSRVSVDGTNFFVAYGEYWNLVNEGKWEPHTFKIFKKFLDSAHSMIDIGAWVGPTALYGCQLASICYAIEPDPLAFSTLQYNLSLNPNLESKLKLFNYAISDHLGEIKLTSETEFGDSQSSILSSSSKNFVMVKGITLDKFVQENNITDCNFIKIDIEGGETIVVPNIKNFLIKYKPTLHLSLHPFWFHDSIKDSLAIVDTLRIYKDLLTINGDIIPLDYLKKFLLDGKQCEIVATDRVLS